ncbi:hypothetical protein RBSH_06028 [Rhodopirellula baltica SH28]|uniref:Uncharacterized protein n=2 Tax=Rhodopirellula baltica TaxID=265606 RepID=K5DZ37_RHOBT|nr:hypothetical protein RBSH_06028 [Rhodopirellula baltica SH28]
MLKRLQRREPTTKPVTSRLLQTRIRRNRCQFQCFRMTQKQAKSAIVGPRQFQWQGSGWFGCVVGGSAWLVPMSAILALNGQPLLALVPLGCCLLAILFGIALWHNRDRVRPFRALIGMLMLFSITTPFAWFTVSTNASPDSLVLLNWPQSIAITAMVAVICPTIAIWFCFLEYAHHGTSKRASQDA